MKTIGLIAAMSLESGALLRYIKRWKRIGLGRFDCKSFEIYEHHCVLVTSGMGIRRASEATSELVKTDAPRLLISFGIAGAVEADLEIGDVVLVEEVCQLEDGAPGRHIPLQSWSIAAQDAATQVLARGGRRLYRGTAVTTGGSPVSMDQLAGVRHPILEMETMGIARVAAEEDVPLLAVRSISDGPSAPIPFDLGEMMDEEANLRMGKLAGEIVRHPGILSRLIQMRRNSNSAAEYAAQALMALLVQLHAGEGSPH